MTSLSLSNSQRVMKLVKNRPIGINNKNPFPLSNKKSSSPPLSSLIIKYEHNKKNKKYNNNLSRNILINRLSSLSLNENKSKYANINIFQKREIAFHKSIENNKKVFKYQNYSLFEEKSRITLNSIKRNLKKNNTNRMRRNASSLYLTENLLGESKSSMLPFINKGKSKVNSFNYTDKNEIKKNIKIIKNSNFLIELTKKNEIDKLNKSIEEKKEDKIIYKKIDLINMNNKKDLKKNKYLENMREYLLEKYNTKIKKEKNKIIRENFDDKSIFIDDKIKSLQNDYNCFNDSFSTRFNEYIKQIMIIKDIEKDKDNKYI